MRKDGYVGLKSTSERREGGRVSNCECLIKCLSQRCERDEGRVFGGDAGICFAAIVMLTYFDLVEQQNATRSSLRLLMAVT